MRWDLPELGAATGSREAVDGRSPRRGRAAWIDATRRRRRCPSCPTSSRRRPTASAAAVRPALPKVIVSNRAGRLRPDAVSTPIDGAVGRRSPARRSSSCSAPMYHTNGFATSDQPARRRPPGGAGEVRRRARSSTRSSGTASPRSPRRRRCCKRIADLPGIDDRDLSSIEWILQGAAPMPPYLVHRWVELHRRRADPHGLRHDRGPRHHRAPRRRVAAAPRAASAGRSATPRCASSTPTATSCRPARSARSTCARRCTAARPTSAARRSCRRTDDGFATVGDIGYLDEDGYLYLVDRRVDMIITGGANVFPAEVETALIDHPEIADVVVIGLKDDEWGRRVHAIVEPDGPGRPAHRSTRSGRSRSRASRRTRCRRPSSSSTPIPRSAATKVNRGALLAERGG